MRALVTGASGFIGTSLCRHLLSEGWSVRAATASEAGETALRDRLGASGGLSFARVPRSCDSPEGWRTACQDRDVVFHLAGIAHRVNARDTEALYRRVNVDLTLALARAASQTGVLRLVFAGSATVYGNASPAGMPFSEISPVAPEDVYARSKREAEIGLTDRDWGRMRVTVARFPMVYGAGAKGNLRALMKLVDLGLPLPFARFENRRSLVSLDNLVDFLRRTALCEDAADRILLVSDRKDVSTPELIRAIAQVLGRPARLFPVPPGLLKAVCGFLGQSARYEKLAGSFQIDPAQSCALLDWRPKSGFSEGIAHMCAAFRKQPKT